MACVHAAGCDLAIADAAFRAVTDDATGDTVLAALMTTRDRALKDFARCPEAEGLSVLMGHQLARIMAMGLPVRSSAPCRGVGGSLLACRLTPG